VTLRFKKQIVSRFVTLPLIIAEIQSNVKTNWAEDQFSFCKTFALIPENDIIFIQKSKPNFC